MGLRDELIRATVERYGRGSRAEKARLLDEFVAVTGFHRKHAMRVLRGGPPSDRSGPRPERRLYDAAVREALIVVWEASDLWQAAEASRSGSGGILGAAWPPGARGTFADCFAGDECCNHGPRPGGCARPCRWSKASPDYCFGWDPPERAGSHVF